MARLRCLECGHFAGRIVGRVEVVGTVKHSDRADPDNDVIPCSSCGRLHEIRRTPKATAA